MITDIFNKISILGPSAKYDTCGPKDFGDTTGVPGVYHAKVGGGHVCRLFKVLQTNVCKNNCKYCAFRKDRNIERTVASPDEMAKAFDMVYKNQLVDGLFLSSGIAGTPDMTMSSMIDTANILRGPKYKYNGYIHLKIMPGSSPSSIRESIRLANRVSINVEAPTETSLRNLSEEKNLWKDLYLTLNKIKSEINKVQMSGQKRVPTITTQFIVGAGEESDKELIKNTNFLYNNFGLKRVFYSSFNPVIDTPLENKPAESITRVHRLYQSDFLMSEYGFKPEEIPLDSTGNLSAIEDPKLAWANIHPELFPVNINTATYHDLIRIPGIGPVSARKILNGRRGRRIQRIDDLSGLRIQVNKIEPWIRF